MKPKVSVIVPIYGVEKYIEQCARSLFEQTLNDIEFIFVDDCSPDHSMSILSQIIEQYHPRIIERNWSVRIEKMTKNSGLAAVRQYGIKLAEGDYIIQCDSDDWPSPNMYKVLLDKALIGDYDLVFCDYYINGIGSETVCRRDIVNYSNKNDIIRYTLTTSLLNPVWGVLAKRELFSRIVFPSGSQSEDKTFVIQLAILSSRYAHVASPLYHYRLTPNSISRSTDLKSIIKRYKELENNRVIIRDFSDRYGYLSLYPKEFQSYFFSTKMILKSYLQDEQCRKLWMSSFVESNKGILWNPYITIREKISFFSSWIKIMCKFPK